MRNKADIEEPLKKHFEESNAEFGANKLGLFGSYVRDEQNERSDEDILVGFDRLIGMFRFMDIEERLSEIIGCRVDLVTEDALKPVIGKPILSEVVYI